jgi:two-component system OmpR family sensor kinase
MRILSAPLRSQDGKLVGVVQCGLSLARLRAEEARTTRTLLTLIPLVLIVAGLGGAFLTDRALRPVRGLAHEAGKIEAGNLSQRLPITGDDEFAELAETFNGMLARLQVAFESQEEAFEQQRRFTADASHELRTPLTIIKANTSLALSGTRTAPELLKTVQTVNTAADRMTRIVQDLLLLARSDAGQLTYALVPTPLSDVVSQALGAAQGPDHAPITVALKPESLAVIGNADALVRLFSNLLENAARYTPSEGRITVSAETLGDVVSVKVTDTGEGIAPEHLPHLTERFYRVEASRSRPRGGTGLGLAICRSIVEAHAGELSIESVLGRGTTVRVTLPLAEQTPVSCRIEEPQVLARA